MNDELYHYGTPGMKWGVRKSNKSRSVSSNTRGKKASRTSSNTKPKIEVKQKRKLSKSAKIAIGATAATAALAGIGAMLASKTVGNKVLAAITARALGENM